MLISLACGSSHAEHGVQQKTVSPLIRSQEDIPLS